MSTETAVGLCLLAFVFIMGVAIGAGMGCVA